jgi:hypothetical protein
MFELLDREPLPAPYRLPTGRIVLLRATAPSVPFAVTPDWTVVAIRADLREPW